MQKAVILATATLHFASGLELALIHPMFRLQTVEAQVCLGGNRLAL